MSGEGMISDPLPDVLGRHDEAVIAEERAAIVYHLRCKLQAVESRLARQTMDEGDQEHVRRLYESLIEEIESGLHRRDGA